MKNNLQFLAIRIYYVNGYIPKADLVCADGTLTTINWASIDERKILNGRVNGYTLIYDERPKRLWSEWETFIIEKD